MLNNSFEVLDNIILNFSLEGLMFMNITIALIMFGVALDIKITKFKLLLKNPLPVFVGLVSQTVLLPFATFLLILAIKPSHSIALGMILVASCPGGNISNFISSFSKSNTELSVSLTTITTSLAVFITPLNFSFWGSLYAKSSLLLRPLEIDIFLMFETVFILLLIPLLIGITFSKKFPKTTLKIIKPIKWSSIFLFASFVLGALFVNFEYFIKYIHLIFIIVLLHNLTSLLIGYYFSKLFRLKNPDRQTISIETGIQNSGLALVLIFNPNIFPPELKMGGMAFIAGLWGIWHIISGMSLAFYWNWQYNINTKNIKNE